MKLKIPWPSDFTVPVRDIPQGKKKSLLKEDPALSCWNREIGKKDMYNLCAFV